MQKMDIGLIGLGVMGENLALNLARHGFSVSGFDLDAAKRESFGQRTQDLNAQAAASLEALVASLQTPRCVWLMVPAGAAVDAVLRELQTLLSPGDVVMDGGNTLYTDTQRRMLALDESGIHYVEAGVSVSEECDWRGAARKPGGSAASWPARQTQVTALCPQSRD